MANADAILLAPQGRNQRKVLVMTSDGNDTSSQRRANKGRQPSRNSQINDMIASQNTSIGGPSHFVNVSSEKPEYDRQPERKRLHFVAE
jgi:hypothetical protein